ncbi:hypothetical protein TPA0908_32920 [Micromonospora sp. AKA38]|nr:hypothetical protein TPA0908_32920 [Micromonospora sp. AKA38]
MLHEEDAAPGNQGPHVRRSAGHRPALDPLARTEGRLVLPRVPARMLVDRVRVYR